MTAALRVPEAPHVDLQSPATAAAAMRVFFRLAEAWALSVSEQATLLGVGRTTLYQWKQGKVGPLDRHVLERLSHLFGIYAALQILLPVRERADAWLRKPNDAPLFGGRPALERMLGGQVSDLFVVRQYLDAQRGGKA
jgi:transcriptional regulator with XRE-family HTH domain